jgi:transcriptional repressor NrdR
MPHVVKRDGRREPFDEIKLRAGITRALEKRPVNSEDVEASISRVIHLLQTKGEREVTGRLVGDMVMDALHELDEVAYVRFASVYRSFQDITEFQDEIQKLRLRPSPLADREQMSLLPDDGDDET